MSRVVVSFADIHAGHRLGLMCPTIKLPDPDLGERHLWKPTPTKTQEWLWSNYTRIIKDITEWAGDDEIILLFDGDTTWGKKHPSKLISTRDYDQILIAAADIAWWMIIPNVTTLRLMMGTESHEFGEGSAPYSVVKHLRENFATKDIACCRHGLFTVEGVTFDVDHHGPSPGRRTWTSGNQLRYNMRDMRFAALLHGDKPPHVVIRAHYHHYIKEMLPRRGIIDYPMYGYVLPAFCGLTHYAERVTRSTAYLNCGMVALRVEDGRVLESRDYEEVIDIDLRTKEVL